MTKPSRKAPSSLAKSIAPRATTQVDAFIGGRIRAHRLKLKMSQEKLASEIGVTLQQVQKYERGTNRVAAVKLFDISRALDVPIAAFLPAQRDMTESGDLAEWAQDGQSVALLLAFNQLRSKAAKQVLLELVHVLASVESVNKH